MKKNLFKGSLFTVGASLWWGVIGVFYFKFVSFASPLELTIHRTIWTALLLVITTSYYLKWPQFNKIIKKKKEFNDVIYNWFTNFNKLVHLALCRQYKQSSRRQFRLLHVSNFKCFFWSGVFKGIYK